MLLLDFGNVISRKLNALVMGIHRFFLAYPVFGVTDLVPAYSSIGFCFNSYAIRQKEGGLVSAFAWVKEQIETQLSSIISAVSEVTTTVEIPVCYDSVLGNDLENISASTGLSITKIVELHSSGNYLVYMLGFLPGFAYMGEVDARLQIPRKAEPARVVAGSVAIAGQQTGVYPLDSFGGWNVVGHTPVKMFNKELQSPCYLNAGIQVIFKPITVDEYHANA